MSHDVDAYLAKCRPDHPIPEALVVKLITARLAEITAMAK